MGRWIRFVTLAWLASVTSASALAIVPQTGDTNWYPFSTSAYFDGASWDGAGCHVGNWISATGGCAWAGFYDRSPGMMPDFLGSGSTGFSFQSSAPVTVDFLERLSAWDSEYGWVDSDGNLHALFINTPGALGSRFTFMPNGWFALYEKTPDGLFTTAAASPGRLSQFVAFNESAECVVIGAEDIDRSHAINDHDFQDTIVRVCSPAPTPVSEPATLALLATGLLGTSSYVRARFRQRRRPTSRELPRSR
jgi:hypothetical protein